MTRLTYTDWLENALDLLVREGHDALTIETMCQRLGVTKGSFYHHFKGRSDFLEAVLQYWEETYTTRFIEFSLEGSSPEEQIQRLNQRVIESYSAAEVAIRAWAQISDVAREYQQRVDQRRINFIYELQMQLHHDEARAKTLARLFYAVLVGAQSTIPPMSRADLQAMFQLISDQSTREI